MSGTYSDMTAANSHQIPIRVYYEDTDAGGVVYYANHLRFAERGRTEWLRALGLNNSELRAQCGILIVVKTAEIDYKKPARLDDSLTLDTQLLETGATSMKMRQILRKDRDEIAVMNITLVCVAEATGRPQRWPEPVLMALNKNEGTK
jgi:acyl-CoA thioester hydrolase